MTILLFKRITYFILTGLFTFLAFLKPTISHDSKKHTVEQYNQDLSTINSLEKASEYIDNECAKANLSKYDTIEFVKLISRFTKQRFYHGLSHYDISENWIAYLSGKFLWAHLSAIVDPNDILKHQEGLCSQQTIVFMELLKQKKISVRSIGLGYKEGPGHFLSEVNYSGSWHLYDVTMEPAWKKVVNHHKSIEYYLNNKDSLYLAYEGKYDRALFNKLLERVTYGKNNDFSARNMLLFHRLTLALGYLLPIIFLILFLFSILKKRNAIKMAEELPVIKTKMIESLS